MVFALVLNGMEYMSAIMTQYVKDIIGGTLRSYRISEINSV